MGAVRVIVHHRRRHCQFNHELRTRRYTQPYDRSMRKAQLFDKESMRDNYDEKVDCTASGFYVCSRL
jgi:hypothetical protein